MIGDSCRPKYLGSRQVSFRFDERSKRTFVWQASTNEYLAACASIGIMHLQNVFNLEWLQVDNQQKAIWFYMPSSNIYEGSMNMTVDYAGQKDRVLQIELVQVYHVPRVDPPQTDYFTVEFYSLQ